MARGGSSDTALIVWTVALGVTLSTVALVACSLDLNGYGPAETEDGGGNDGPGGDTTPADAPSEAGCQGLSCNGSCMPGATDCSQCTGAPLLCTALRACVSDCTSGCGQAAPLECFVCDQNAQNPYGMCEVDDAVSNPCLNGNFNSAYIGGAAGRRCSCAGGNASACPGADQICASNDVCFECGDLGLTVFDAGLCKNGHACNPATNTCN